MEILLLYKIREEILSATKKTPTQYCREIFKVLHEAQQHYTEIKLVYSMPVSLAIAVGMTIQHFWNVKLTNYDPKTETYADLIKMNEIIYQG
ncbi:SAVED domain-containing protein [Floridanema aerugineum]|jgi:hypothetical protein|uniref:SAVED domain-containing protein n=1 Tax=Floridaenema aerugineum BLCC-F46 TaxID=3153654 RepID=A0ABV4WZG7_9CYAN